MATSKPTPIGQCKLIDVRLSFPKLFTPEASVADGPLKFGSNFMIAPLADDDEREDHCDKNLAAAKKAYDAVYASQWKDKKVILKDDRKAYREGEKFTNQETGEIYAGYEGAMIVTASRKAAKAKDPNDSSHARMRPPMFRRNKDPIKDDDGTLYGGCRVDAVVNFYAVTGQEKGGNGIFATIEAIRFRRDDTPFGAAAVGADAFDDLDDEDDDGGI